MVEQIIDFITTNITILMSVIALIVTITIFLLKIKRPKLNYIFNNLYVIGNFRQLNDISIQYKGEEIKELNLLKISLINTGNEIVHFEDFSENERPCIVLPEEASIYNIEVDSVRGINNVFTKLENRNTINLTFDFLNPNDSISLKVLHDSSGLTDLSVSGRLKNAPKIKRLSNESPWWVLLNIILSVFTTIVIIGIIELFGFTMENLYKYTFWIWVGITLLIAVKNPLKRFDNYNKNIHRLYN